MTVAPRTIPPAHRRNTSRHVAIVCRGNIARSRILRRYLEQITKTWNDPMRFFWNHGQQNPERFARCFDELHRIAVKVAERLKGRMEAHN